MKPYTCDRVDIPFSHDNDSHNIYRILPTDSPEKCKEKLERGYEQKERDEYADKVTEARIKVKGLVELGLVDQVKDRAINGDDFFLKAGFVENGLYIDEIISNIEDDDDKAELKWMASAWGHYLDECATDPNPEIRENVAYNQKYAERFLNDPDEDVREAAEWMIEQRNPIIINE